MHKLLASSVHSSFTNDKSDYFPRSDLESTAKELSLDIQNVENSQEFACGHEIL